jgi:cyclase
MSTPVDPHPREGRDLLDRIRKVTDRPIKWVINSHFHGDHHMGNSVFKEVRSSSLSRKRRISCSRFNQRKRRGAFEGFKSRGYDRADVKLVLPDAAFDSKMTIHLGGREIRFFYLGQGQQAGETFVAFPHARLQG